MTPARSPSTGRKRASPVLVFTATCVGPVDTATDERSVRLILSEVVSTLTETACTMTLISARTVWEKRKVGQQRSTDHDGDGCRDRDEDEDDDNDGISDASDGCLSEPGWTSARLRIMTTMDAAMPARMMTMTTTDAGTWRMRAHKA